MIEFSLRDLRDKCDDTWDPSLSSLSERFCCSRRCIAASNNADVADFASAKKSKNNLTLHFNFCEIFSYLNYVALCKI